MTEPLWPFWPFGSPRPLCPPTPEELERWRKAIEESVSRPAHLRARRLLDRQMTITGPALHETEVRAHALIAAANLTPPNSRPRVEDLELWQRNVMRTAEVFAGYINSGRQSARPAIEGNEDSSCTDGLIDDRRRETD
jgi:hypothetical protein